MYCVLKVGQSAMNAIICREDEVECANGQHESSRDITLQ